MTHRLLQRVLSSRALVALGLGLTLGGGAGVHVVQDQIKGRVLDGAQATARVIVSLVVSRNVTAGDVVHGHLADQKMADMNGDLAQLRESQDIVGLQVWKLATGSPLYTNAGLPPSYRPPASQLAQSRTGRTVRTPMVVGGLTVLEVLLPYSFDGGATVPAVVVVILPGNPVNSAVSRWTRVLYAGALAIAALTVGAVWGARRRYRREEHAARHDGLTGLGNRALLTEAARVPLQAMTPTRGVAALLVDLHGVREINDTLGHNAGNQLLRTVAARLTTTCTAAVAVTRLGGDEFLVLYAGLDTTDSATREALTHAERILAALREPITVSGLAVEIDASVGVAVGPHHGTELGNLLQHADVAMYEAKQTGNGARAYDPATGSHQAAQLTVLAELRQALATDQLRLYYQPKAAPDGSIADVEALVRWQHPTRGLIPPGDFLPLAERTPLIKPLTAWVLAEAARQCAAWRAAGRTLHIAVNVSARNLHDDDLLDALRQATTAAGVPVNSLAVEVTETAMMDPARAGRILSELRRLGVQVFIDDFGVGYTSLSYLSTLPAHAIKIDQSFVARILDSPVDDILVRTVIDLARDLGMTCIAEGVETHEVWQRLTDLGCDQIQGYLLTRPLPPDQFIEWLDNWRPHLPRISQHSGLTVPGPAGR